MSDMGSEIATFYKGRSVFITGASGFIGKVLVEKLLRSCPDIDVIYVLMRPKRGNDVRTRMDELLNAKLFDLLRRTKPSSLLKVTPIIGDITQPGLGISNDDATLLFQQVSVVFHSAATVRFEEPLKQAATLNIVGTKSIIQLCRKMKNLAALIHVSTAYCNCNQNQVDEIIYPPPADAEKIIEWLQWMDEDLVNKITPKILGSRPNTYTYTKALAEHLFHEQASDMPAAIVRPSIVTASWREPLPGWVDNLNGPTGLIAGIGKGLIKSLLCDVNLVCDMIPVDVLSNLMIAVAWKTATDRDRHMMVYNCTSSTVNPIKWKTFRDVIGEYMFTHPFREVYWYPGGTLKKSRFLHQFQVQFNHMLPAYLMDIVARLVGKKPHFVALQRKLWRAVSSLEYFTTHEWRFTSRNTVQLYKQLCESDRKLFNFDIQNLNWSEYLITYFEGIRKYILKESSRDPSNFTKMYYLHRTTQIMTVLLIFKLLRIGKPAIKSTFYSLLNLSLLLVRFLPLKS